MKALLVSEVDDADDLATFSSKESTHPVEDGFV